MMDRFQKISRSLDRGWRAQIISPIGVIKTLDFRPLDRDRTAEMRSARSNRSRYNAPIYARAVILDPMVRAPRDRRPSIDRPPDPTFRAAPRRLQGR